MKGGGKPHSISPGSLQENPAARFLFSSFLFLVSSMLLRTSRGSGRGRRGKVKQESAKNKQARNHKKQMLRNTCREQEQKWAK